jgi:hypothetical protein
MLARFAKRPSGALVLLLLGLGLSAAGTPASGQDAAGAATYEVTFTTTWTAETHPADYPGSAHFSGLIGGTHDAGVAFWTPGEPASLGIKRMAEWGSQAELTAEIEAAIAAGDAGEVIAGLPLWDVPGSTSLQFTATPAHPLVTLTTMIAPSPDWFLGVRGLDLRPGGQWVESLTVDLLPWDAGTDSGASYGSGDQPTAPPQPISAITGGPPSPGMPLGTFTFTLLAVADVPSSGTLWSQAYPNPFNPRTTIAWELPAAGDLRVAVYDAAGRHIRTLHAGRAAAGPGRAVWDGTDDGGRRVASGAYVYRLKGPGGVRSEGITLLK